MSYIVIGVFALLPIMMIVGLVADSSPKTPAWSHTCQRCGRLINGWGSDAGGALYPITTNGWCEVREWFHYDCGAAEYARAPFPTDRQEDADERQAT